jgi:hypothetical protein
VLSVEEERGEREVDSGLRFTADAAVVVRVRRRLHRYMLDDRGDAARIAGRPPGWRELAHEVVVREHGLNVDRQGQVFVPTVRPALLDELVLRVAAASLALYVALLELQD